MDGLTNGDTIDSRDHLTGPTIDDGDAHEDEELGSKANPAELLTRVRAGDNEAAYELLGRQAPVKAWRDALSQLAKAPDRADLEQAAHRSLRRPPEVVSALLDLAEAAGSPQAALVARAVSKLRLEPSLVSRANELRERLLTALDIDLLLASNDGLGALYVILGHDLAAQPSLIERLSTDTKASKMISDALGREYQRLLELGRTVRWKSGSYRYLLRHALANLALLSGVHGRTGQLAYRLLQQQVEGPEENEELLDLLPTDARRTYLTWALERENAGSYGARTRFALSVARRHAADVDRALVVDVARTVSDAETAAEAFLTAVELGPTEADVDRDIAERAEGFPADVARRLFRQLLEVEPRRIRLDLFGSEMLKLLIEAADDAGDVVVRQISELLPRLPDVDSARDLLQTSEQIAEKVPVSDGSFEAIARHLTARSALDARWEHALVEEFVAGARLRGALWIISPEIEPPLRSAVLRGLIEKDEPDLNATHATQVLNRLDEIDDGTAALLADAVLSGAIDPRSLEGSPDSHLARVAVTTVARTRVLENEATEAAALLESGQAAAEAKLLDGLRPIINRAIERAEGNSRLQDDFRRLLSKAVEPDDADAEPETAVPASVAAELARLGAVIEGTEDDLVVRVKEPNDTQTNVRYLAALDQRVSKSTPASRDVLASVLQAYVLALGRTGDAAGMTADLFGRGPLMRVALGLSSHTRELVVRAALENGLEANPSWLEDDRLGDWLATILGGDAVASSRTADSKSSIAVLEDARRTAEVARTTRDRLERLQFDAKKAFVERTLPAFDDLELAIDGYIQLWQALAQLGVSQVASLGASVSREDIDPDRHELVSETPGETYVVRSAGIVVDGAVLVKARLEPEAS